jgi:hypothetical protein
MKTILLRMHSPAREELIGRGLNSQQYSEAFDHATLLNATLSNQKFQAEAAANALLPSLRGRRVVLIGRGLAEAFGLRAPALEWTRMLYRSSVNTEAYTEMACLPSPSPINSWWNVPANEAAAARFLQAEASLGMEFTRRKMLVLG